MPSDRGATSRCAPTAWGDDPQDLADLDEVTLQAVVDRLVETLAALHAVDHVAIGLGGLGRPDGYAARQVKRWSGQWEIVGDPAYTPLAEELGGRLRAVIFEQASTGTPPAQRPHDPDDDRELGHRTMTAGALPTPGPTACMSSTVWTFC